MHYWLAIDIGASSGRHILGSLADGKIVLEEVYRFVNTPIKKNGHLCWDIDRLFDEVIEGLRRCKAVGKIPVSIGIDTWAVDFALIDGDGRLLGDIVSYRDRRTKDVDLQVEKIIPFVDLYTRTGIQKQPFNTVYQLMALKNEQPELLEQVSRLLMVPDYLHYRLTGAMTNEYTNATTTALVGAQSKDWDLDLIDRLNLPRDIFGPIVMPGETIGHFTIEVQKLVGFDSTVVLPATHDTGSAFLAAPAHNDSAITLSSGTWSLLGVERDAPITTARSLAGNFTNEGGYGGRFRLLKNIMGLWMIQSVRRELGSVYSFADLEQLARQAGEPQAQIDVNDARFLAPDGMIEAVKSLCADTGQPVPETTDQLMACIYHSLAASYADAVAELVAISGQRYACIHIVGGGCKDRYLNELTAAKTGLPVYAGPTEATALGNLIAQMMAAGIFENVAQARQIIRNSFGYEKFQ